MRTKSIKNSFLMIDFKTKLLRKYWGFSLIEIFFENNFTG